MSDDPRNERQQRAARQCFATLMALEGEIAAALDGQRALVLGYPDAAHAVQRFSKLAASQRDTLSAHLADMGAGSEPDNGGITLASLLGAAAAGSPLAASTALWSDYTAFQHMVMGYARMYGLAHRAYAERRDQPGHRIAEQHQRRYAEAAQEIVRLMPDLMLWELEQRGEECRCLCPCCRTLGLCICFNAARSLTAEALTETALPQEGGVVVRQLRPGSAAKRAGLRAGDVIVRVDDEERVDCWEINRLLSGLGSGRPVQLWVADQGSEPRAISVQI
jgi:hypothetical protein